MVSEGRSSLGVNGGRSSLLEGGWRSSLVKGGGRSSLVDGREWSSLEGGTCTLCFPEEASLFTGAWVPEWLTRRRDGLIRGLLALLCVG